MHVVLLPTILYYIHKTLHVQVEANLRCLPIFLTGCTSLLVLAGPSYPSRLWCCMELFIFMRMGGNFGEITVLPLVEGEGMAGLAAQLASFDAGLTLISYKVYSIQYKADVSLISPSYSLAVYLATRSSRILNF